MSGNVLNITNGDAFNRFLLEKQSCVAVPFREAMMDGEVTEELFSAEFIRARAAGLGVSEEIYRANMLDFDALACTNYDSVKLWFGKDTFCQMNLVLLLAYLEKIGFSGDVFLNYIDDETFEIIEENIVVVLGIYTRIYKEIFVEKRAPSDVGALCPDAIKLYFDYHSDSGKLADLVRKNRHLDEYKIMCILMENSGEYGLSDLQAARLIKKYKS